MKILVKFPTRERHYKWSKLIRLYIDKASGPVQFMITLDHNDPQLPYYLDTIKHLSEEGVDILHYVDVSYGKIYACNRDMDHAIDWDIVVLASDDMVPVKNDWDKILIDEMTEHFPDTDGVLFHNDGYLEDKLNTMCILGKKYYDRFGFIYHKSFKSLWCDNLFQDQANKLGKMIYFPEVLFKHEHFSNDVKNAHTRDALMSINESFYYEDKAMYYKLKKELGL